MNKTLSKYISHILYMSPAIVLLSVGVFYYRKFDVDDTFIYFVYVKNLLNGNGLTFNGTYVEGFSSVIWVSLLSFFSLISEDILQMAKLISFAFALGNIALLYLVILRASGHRLYATLGTLVFAASPIVSLWTAGAIETQMFTFIFLLSIHMLAMSPESNRVRICTGVIFGLLAASRPEGFAIFGIVPLFYLYEKYGPDRSKQPQSVIYAGFLGSIALLLLWRYSLYSDILPNTVYAKTGPLLFNITEEGLNYTILFFRLHFPVITAVALAINLVYALGAGGNTYARRLSFLSVVSISGYTAFIIAVNGDWMPGLRLFVPIVAFIAYTYVIATLYLYCLTRRLSLRTAIIIIPALCIAVLTYNQFAVNELMESNTYNLMNSDLRKERRILPELIRYIRDNTSEKDYVAVVDAGEIPYRINSGVIDMAGLNDKHIASLPGDFMQKYDNDYVLSFKPKMIQMHLSKSATGAQWPVNFMGSVELFYSKAFQSNYEMVDHGLFRRLDTPKTEHLMTDYYNDLFRVADKVTVDDGIEVELTNRGTGVWIAGLDSWKWGTMYVHYVISDSNGTAIYKGIVGIESDIYPGKTSEIGLPLPPLESGLYYLQLNLIHYLSEQSRPVLRVTTLSFKK